MTIPLQDPTAVAEALKKVWMTRYFRKASKTELEREEQRIKAAERFKEKYKAYFPAEGPLRRELYPKQIKFFAAGAEHNERLFIAGNRCGKTDAGSYELTLHLTGLYPEWWQGKRFNGAIRAWACGDTNKTVRDILQAKLLGRISAATKGIGDDLLTGLGTGFIPGANILGTRRSSGIPDAVEIAYLKHVSGGTSQLNFKSYEQGREAFQGTEQHVIWLDEEPSMEVYTECLMRTMTCDGMLMVTFTPLSGLTEVVLSFLPGGELPQN